MLSMVMKSKLLVPRSLYDLFWKLQELTQAMHGVRVTAIEGQKRMASIKSVLSGLVPNLKGTILGEDEDYLENQEDPLKQP